MTPQIKHRIDQIRRGEVPEGYKKTKVGIVPEEWECIKMGALFRNRNETNCEELRLLSITADKGVIPRDQIDRKDNSSEDKSKYLKICNGDIGYNTMRMWQGVSGLSQYEGIVSPAYTILVPNEKANAYFYAYLFKTARTIFTFHRYSQGIVDDTLCLKYDAFSKIAELNPPLAEQEKIAEILATQDKVIALKEKLLEEKKKQKKYLMQQLLTGKKRLPGFSGEWKKKKVGDLCDTFSGGTPNREHPEYFGGTIPWIKSGELNQSNILSTDETITEQGLISSSAKIVKAGTLLIAMYGATAGVVATTHIDAAINQAILALVPKVEVNQAFLKNSIISHVYVAVNKLTQGGQPNFNASIIESFQISMPSIEEQDAIAKILLQGDKEIAIIQKAIHQEKQKKKALMQLLLTGIVRV